LIVLTKQGAKKFNYSAKTYFRFL